MNDASLMETIARLFEEHGIDLAAWGLAWARVAPLVAIVPAFGLRALSVPIRATTALLLAALILPALRPEVHGPLPGAVLVLLELARGTVVAVSAAVPLWAATMAGGVVDALRGSEELLTMPTVEGRAPLLGVLFSLLAATIFLGMGGPSHVVAALASVPFSLESAASRSASDIARGVGVAVSLAAPLLAASVIVEVAGALVVRAASPAHLQIVLAPIRSLALLALAAILLQRIAGFFALSMIMAP
ncbi:MAG TPA: flagellar biosynthetic protein FliR [Polyangiaceae bacterium]|nr:flagellar biosynthetic protein FliR [Polyangiaceae bacterium]